MPGTDPSHWLHRLSAREWLAAAETELGHCRAALARRATRPAVTHARRAAGMAVNALLINQPNEAWGRSYMEHLVAAAAADAVPAAVRAAAKTLCDTPAAPPTLVQLGRPDTRVLDAARAVLDFARASLPPAQDNE